MSPTKAAPKSVTYHGGLDSVVLHLPSGHVVEFPNGSPVEVCAADAKSLADHPDFQAPKATTPTTKPLKEDA